MNFLRKIFGLTQRNEEASETASQAGSVEQLQQDTTRLWALLKETVEYYKSLACPCAFPRFIQYTSVDCRETNDSFYMSETEGFIQNSADCFDSKEIDKGNECYKAIYTCKTCGSTYTNAWSDFSISVSRNYLKPLHQNVQQVGADAQKPIPFYVGLFGHSYPNRADFKQVDYDTFRDYLRALKNST